MQHTTWFRQTSSRSLSAIIFLSAAMIVASLTAGCAGTQALKRKIGPEYAAETKSWARALTDLGGPGMWLITRGYHTGDDVVAVATNSPLSHASVYDHSADQVVEAVGTGVRTNKIEPFLTESHRVILVRPKGWTLDKGKEAVAKAKKQVGAGYDFLGVVGAPSGKRWYCSELACWSMGIEVGKIGAWNVMHPRKMPSMGDVLFDSGQRDGKVDLPSAASATGAGS